jgi:serine/threonine-protein kinase
MPDARICPVSGSALPPRAPEGLCPGCLLRAGLDGAALSLSPAGDAGATVSLAGSRVLETIAQNIGPVPRVPLRDTDPDSVAPVLRPPGTAAADPAFRYRIDGEIARGGMGEVLKGRDPDLGRDVAFKVLRGDLNGNPDMVRRFIEEAQIGGQLQHPGIVPVYELGTIADRRPYFSMKLVKGQTLAQFLAARPGPADGLPRFLGIFEQVAQTVAYAHARGVIHRDLKPSNVMVGGSGEVQVMDWGLAKVLPRGGAEDDERAGRVPEQETVVATARSGGDSDVELSRAGSVMETPPYVAPEQARGEVDRIDERADVFALGSILCEVLTGGPAFTGRSSGEIQHRAARADTAEAMARLDACGADAELVALVRDCLAAEPADRPRDAGAVRERITAHLAGVQERLRAAELERARAQARAAEERKRRRVQLGLATSLLALTSLVGLAFTYELNRRQAAAARADRLLAEAAILRDQAAARPDEVARWEKGGDALARITQDAGPLLALPALRDAVETGLKTAQADRDLLARMVDIRSAQADDPDGWATDAGYADAFAAAGLDPDRHDPAGVGARVARRPPSVAAALVAALDHWVSVRREMGSRAPGWTRVLAAARAADPHPDRDALRDALLVEDKDARLARLWPLADRAGAGGWAPVGLVLLGEALADAGDRNAGIAVLRRASWAHPEDARAHFALGRLLESALPPQADEAIRAHSLAWCRQPELAGHALAHALENRDRGAEAEAVWRDLIARRPEDGRHLGCYGAYLKDRGRGAEAAPVLGRAISAQREAIRLHPEQAMAHFHLGNALAASGDATGAIAAYREAARLKPDLAVAHYRLGSTLGRSGDGPGAVAAFREAIRHKPDDARAYSNLGLALRITGDVPGAIAAAREAIRLRPDYAEAHTNLAIDLRDSGDLPGGIAAAREAIRLKPDRAEYHNNLAIVLRASGDLPGAIATLREAIRLKPDLPQARQNLGSALQASGDLPGAIAAAREVVRRLPDGDESHWDLGTLLYTSGDHRGAAAALREAIRLKPDRAEAHYLLGNTLIPSGDTAGALAEYREAIRLKPDYAEAHCNVGSIYLQQGRSVEARDELRLGHALGSKMPNWPHPSAEWLARAERTVARDERLNAALAGAAGLSDNAERLDLGQRAFDTRRYAGAARLWGEALDSDLKLGDDRRASHRYQAACAAALAAAGQGVDDPRLDDAARAGLRRRALAWLQAERDAWTRLLESATPEQRQAIVKTLTHWQSDPKLASVRAEAIGKLPEAERADWQALWSEVDRLLTQAGESR